jgi:hypothetical protein
VPGQPRLPGYGSPSSPVGLSAGFGIIGDRPGAQLVLTRYLAGAPVGTLPKATDQLGFMALALRDLALGLAEVAAEQPE